MKKIFALLSVLSIMSIPAFAAEEAVATSLETETTESYEGLNDFTDFSHWSLSLNAGMSQFDGDVKQKYDQIFSASKVSWTIGLEAEYSWNPVWGLL